MEEVRRRRAEAEAEVEAAVRAAEERRIETETKAAAAMKAAEQRRQEAEAKAAEAMEAVERRRVEMAAEAEAAMEAAQQRRAEAEAAEAEAGQRRAAAEADSPARPRAKRTLDPDKLRERNERAKATREAKRQKLSEYDELKAERDELARDFMVVRSVARSLLMDAHGVDELTAGALLADLIYNTNAGATGVVVAREGD